MAGEALGQLYWKSPAICTIKMPIQLNSNGDIASGNDVIAGNKTFTFNYVKADAEPNIVIYGSDQDSTTGLITTFIGYLLDSEIYIEGIRRVETDTITDTIG